MSRADYSETLLLLLLFLLLKFLPSAKMSASEVNLKYSISMIASGIAPCLFVLKINEVFIACVSVPSLRLSRWTSRPSTNQ